MAPADFPQDGRGPTQITEVEEFTTDARGHDLPSHYSEQTFSQTSDDVSVDPDKFGNRVDGGSVTLTVSNVEALGKNGEMVRSSGAAQAVTLDVNGQSGQGEITLTDSWSSTGESSTGVRAEGFEGQALKNLLSGPEDGESLRIGGQNRYVFSGNEQDSYLLALQNRDASKLLGLSGENPSVDFSSRVGYNAQGQKVSDRTTFGQLEPGEDGRSVTVSSDFLEAEDGQGAHWSPKTWVYSDVTNDGQDFRRQTVIEGTEISTLEERATEPNGGFSYTSQTRDGSTVIANSSTSRQVLTDERIRQALQDGELTEQQARRLLASKEPRWVERVDDSAERYEKDDQLVQNGYSSASFRYSDPDGYEVGRTEQSQNDQEGQATTTSFVSVTDPRDRPPFQGELITREPGDYGRSSQIRIDNQGAIWQDDKRLGDFDLKGNSVSDFITSTGNADGLIRGLFDFAGGASGLEEAAGATILQNGNEVPRYPKLSPRGEAFADFGRRVEGLATVFEGYRVLRGVAEGDGQQVVASGAELVAGHSEAVSAALASFEGKGGLGGKLSFLGKSKVAAKAFGLAGGFANLGFGAYDAFTADTTTGKVSGGLAAASGAALITGAFFGPPGWVIGGIASGVLGLASAVVGASEGVSRSHTEPLDRGF